jgi:branched-chain amino acid transport system substrate-binding protein
MGQPRSAWTRRQFLQRLGVVGAAATVPGLLAACGGDGGDGGAAAGGTSPGAAGNGGGGADKGALKVGLLVPLSGTYASLGRDMQNGFQMYLDRHDGQLGGYTVELIDAETEANPEVGLRAGRRLIEEDNAAIVTGIVSSAVALGVRDLFHENERPLIVSNAGANDVTRSAKSPYIFRTSFSNWQPSFSVGEWAVEQYGGEPFFIIAPDYAAGHEDADAFRESYERNGGGQIAGEVYPAFGTTQDYQPFISQIEQSGAAGCFAFFAGGEAINFVQQYQQFGLKERIPLLGPGFLTDEGVLDAQGDAAIGLRTSLHWTPRLENETNQAFVQEYREKFDALATVYAVQSYDAAQLIDLALKDYDGDPTDGDAVSEAMANAPELDSPRGAFRIDPETHNPIQPFYLREVQEADGQLGNTVVEELGEYADPGA